MRFPNAILARLTGQLIFSEKYEHLPRWKLRFPPKSSDGESSTPVPHRVGQVSSAELEISPVGRYGEIRRTSREDMQSGYIEPLMFLGSYRAT